MNQESIKKMLVGLIIIIALAIGVTLVISMFKKDDGAQQNTNQVESPIQSKTDIPVDKLPDKFPVNVPVEDGAEISQNYNASTKDGSVQATREFVTNKTLAENLTIYKKYLQDNGWIVSATVDTETYKMVAGSKEKQELQISIGENTASKVKTVSISLTQLP